MDYKKIAVRLVWAYIASLTVVVLCAVVIYRYTLSQKADTVYSEVSIALMQYPELPDSYGFAEVYLRKDEAEYLFIKNGSHVISAIRCRDGDTIYYLDGASWFLDEAGELIAVEELPDPVIPILSEAMQSILSEKNVTYVCQRNVGRDQLVGLSAGEWYITCQRGGKDGWTEFMACSDASEESFLFWHVISEPDLHFWVWYESSAQKNLDQNSFWSSLGKDLPGAVYSALLSEAENSSFP